MTKHRHDPDDDRRIENEIRRHGAPDPMQILMGRDGGGHLRGASPTPALQRALLEVADWLEANLDDTEQALHRVILRRLAAAPERLEAHQGHPERLLAGWVAPILDNETALADLVREVDMAWGQANQERPHFQIDGAPAHPDDPYTIAGVREQLTRLRAGRA